MTAWQFKQPWLSELNGDKAMTAAEFANLRSYLKGLDDGTVSLFNPTFQNIVLLNPLPVIYGGTGLATLTSGSYLKGAGTSNVAFQAAPIPVADGGTNSTTALTNGFLIVSSGGKLIEIGGNVSAGSNKITSLAAATANGDAVRFEQLKVIQRVSFSTSTRATSSSTSFADTSFTASITPTSASNKILVSTTAFIETNSATINRYGYFTIKRGSTNLGDTTNGFGYVSTQTAGAFAQCGIGVNFIDSPATTSSTTYTIQIRVDNAADTIAFGLSATPSGFNLWEVV